MSTGIVIKDITVANQHNGRPEIRCFGTARRALERSGANRVHLSLTHERDSALVVLEVLPAAVCLKEVKAMLMLYRIRTYGAYFVDQHLFFVLALPGELC